MYLTWIVTCLRVLPRDAGRTAGTSMITDVCISLHDVKSRPIGRRNPNRARRSDRLVERSGKGGLLVERVGIEPTTPCLQSRCSPS